MDATVDRILMSRSGKDLHREFSRPIFGDENVLCRCHHHFRHQDEQDVGLILFLHFPKTIVGKSKRLEEQLLVSWNIPEKLHSSIRRNREGFGRGVLGFPDPLF